MTTTVGEEKKVIEQTKLPLDIDSNIFLNKFQSNGNDIYLQPYTVVCSFCPTSTSTRCTCRRRICAVASRAPTNDECDADLHQSPMMTMTSDEMPCQIRSFYCRHVPTTASRASSSCRALLCRASHRSTSSSTTLTAIAAAAAVEATRSRAIQKLNCWNHRRQC